jgi:hypothetical protein
MGKRLLTLAIGASLVALALASPAIASTAFVQSASGSSSGASLGVSYSANVAAGDLIVGQFRANGTTKVSDSVNGSWTQAVSTSSEGVTHSIWYFQNAAAGKTTVTVSGATSGSLRAVLGEYSGVATSGALDQTSCNQGTTTSVTTGATASVSTGDLLYAGVGLFEHPRTITAGSSNGIGATLRTQFSSEFGTSGEEDVTSTASGAQNASFKLNEEAASGWAACAAAFHAQSEEAPAPGCNFYAATSGNDKNSGTKEKPYKTLKKLVTSVPAGQVGCLQSGQTFANQENKTEDGELVLTATKGEAGKPVTITSTSANEPAIIAHPMSLEHGANYYTFTHLIFKWKDPAPHGCWNSEGEGAPGKVIHEPLNGTCEAGKGNPEDHVQLALSGNNDSFTYDDINAEHSQICVNIVEFPAKTERANGTHLENDRIHGCGPPVIKTSEGGFPSVNEEPGWHDHAIYDYGVNGVFKNNYIYESSRNGVLFYPRGEGSVAEHNVIDGNGNGVTFAENKKETLKWNLLTNSKSPRKQDDFAIYTGGSVGKGNVAEHNDAYGNEGWTGEGPNIELEGIPSENVLASENIEEDPKYANAAAHQYESPLNTLGYGPTSPPTKY